LRWFTENTGIMSKEKIDTTDEKIEAIEGALSRTEQFIETNYRKLLFGIVGIAVIVGLFFGYKYLILTPKENEAQKQIYTAEQFFARDSFKVALNGDGNALGFAKIADEFGSTKTGNLACYYAGICNLRLGKYEEAIDFLKSYDANDKIVGTLATIGIGDAYVELNKLEEGADYYMKAAKMDENLFTSPNAYMKAGGVFEALGKYPEALEAYNAIKSDYPKSMESRDIDKYIARASLKMEK